MSDDDEYDEPWNDKDPFCERDEARDEVTRLRDLCAVHENMVKFRDAELTRLRALVVELRTALQDLSDVQGVAPYAKDPQYDQAAAQAKAVLDKE